MKALRARRLGPLVLYVVFAVGVVRWINGMDNNLPVGYLTVLLAVTGISLVCLNIRTLSVPKARDGPRRPRGGRGPGEGI